VQHTRHRHRLLLLLHLWRLSASATTWRIESLNQNAQIMVVKNMFYSFRGMGMLTRSQVRT
jgi:hypothetical protein